MDLTEAIAARHSVRKYREQPIEEEKAARLSEEIEDVNRVEGIRAVLFCEEPEAFQANKPHYGSFVGCRNYIAMIGKKGTDGKIGYHGERLVLLAQTLGLNTCWVALTYEKGKVPVTLAEDERIFDLIALGYGEGQGTPHKSRPAEKISNLDASSPEWFRRGVEAALLAPTAINQQRFFLKLLPDGRVSAKALFGPCSATDLGIVRYHFELGAGRDAFTWAD